MPRLLRVLFAACVAVAWMAGNAQALIISEVLFNVPGPDLGNEYIELFNDTAVAVDLADWSLGWGTDDYTFGTLDLDGADTGGGNSMLAPGAYVVIGGPTGTLAIAPELPSGFLNAAGVALFNLDAALIGPLSVPDDAVIFTSFLGINTDLLDSSGAVGSVDGNYTAAGQTVARDASGSWGVQPASDPGTGPMVVMPEPSTALLVGLGLALLATRRSPGDVARRL